MKLARDSELGHAATRCTRHPQPTPSPSPSNPLRAVTGGLAGKRVLEVACGDGIYCRRAAAEGAALVRGVDLSKAMIASAVERSAGLPVCAFAVADAADDASMDAALPGLAGSFDLIMALYLLHYAEDVATLRKMVANLSRFLAPGGSLVVINNHPDAVASPVETFRKYGFEREVVGTRVLIRFLDDDGAVSMTIVNHILPLADHLAACAESGLVDVAIHDPVVDPAALAAAPANYYDDLLKHWTYMLLTARKA